MKEDDARALEAYFRILPRTPLLSAAEEITLAAQMCDSKSSAAERQAARDWLVTTNLRLVVSIAKRYCGLLAMDDLIQEGNLGLDRATRDFDPIKGRFSTYATQWIHQHIRRAIHNQGRTIRIPVHVSARRHALHRETQLFMRTHRRAPTLEEQAALIGVSIAQVRELLAATQPLDSLDQPVHGTEEEPLPLGTVLAAPTHDWDADLIADEQRHALHAALTGLAERERTVLTLRYRIGEASGEKCRTLADVGQQLGITREAVRQTEAKALTKLRTSLGATGM